MKIKQLAVAAAMLGATGLVNAAGLSWTQYAGAAGTATLTEPFNPNGYASALSVGPTISLGYLSSDGTIPGVSYTFLGKEASYIDNLTLTIAPFSQILNTDSPGATVTSSAPAGLLNFEFEGDTGRFAVNTTNTAADWCSTCSIGLIGQNLTVNGVTYQYVIGYNDSAGTANLGDWDDMVIGVNAIPEPETYALMMAGLGLMGFVARRRKQQSAAV